jgi:hypothetical protein
LETDHVSPRVYILACAAVYYSPLARARLMNDGRSGVCWRPCCNPTSVRLRGKHIASACAPHATDFFEVVNQALLPPSSATFTAAAG